MWVTSGQISIMACLEESVAEEFGDLASIKGDISASDLVGYVLGLDLGDFDLRVQIAGDVGRRFRRRVRVAGLLKNFLLILVVGWRGWNLVIWQRRTRLC